MGRGLQRVEGRCTASAMRMRIPKTIFVSLAERLGIGRRQLFDLMTKGK
jgi:hypothetical protein